MSVAQSRSTTEIATEEPLTQLDNFQSKTGCFELHKLQQGILEESKTPSLLFILLLMVSSVTHIYGTNIMETLP